MQRRYRMMATNGRMVSDIPRHELENLVLDLIEENEARKKRAAEGHKAVTRFEMRTMLVEDKLHDVAERMVRCTTVDGKTKRLIEPDWEGRTPGCGSHNPYEAGTRRVVALRHQIGSLSHEIKICNEETSELLERREKLRCLLEKRHVQKEGSFSPTRPIAPHKKKKMKEVVTEEDCVKTLRMMIDAEKDSNQREALLCSYWLLTGQIKRARDIFEGVRDRSVTNDDYDALKYEISIREDQVTILCEQYRLLGKDHKDLRRSYIAIQTRLDDHVVDTGDTIAVLKHQINEIQKRVDMEQEISTEIAELESKRDEIKGKLDAAAEQMRNVDDEVAMKRKLADIRQNCTGLKVQEEQLERRKTELQSRKETMEVQRRALSEQYSELKSDYKQDMGQHEVISKKVTALKRVHVTTAERVSIVDELSRSQDENGVGITVESLMQEAATLVTQCKDMSARRESLSHAVKVKHKDLQSMERRHAAVEAEVKEAEAMEDAKVEELRPDPEPKKTRKARARPRSKTRGKRDAGQSADPTPRMELVTPVQKLEQKIKLKAKAKSKQKSEDAESGSKSKQKSEDTESGSKSKQKSEDTESGSKSDEVPKSKSKRKSKSKAKSKTQLDTAGGSDAY